MKNSIFNAKTLLTLFISAAVMFTSCSKDDDAGTDPDATGTLILEFDHKFDDDDLDFGVTYTNAAGEPMIFDQIKYYISNVELVDDQGNVYTHPQIESYFLVDQSNFESKKAVLQNVPVGSYVEARFNVGVDSLMSTRPAEERIGVLDVTGLASNMYWAWNSGYIFMRVEGTSPALEEGQRFRYHVGGFGGYDSPTPNNNRTVSVNRAGNAPFTVQNNRTRELHIFVDFAKMFSATTVVSIVETPVSMNPAATIPIADNYAQMFELDHIH